MDRGQGDSLSVGDQVTTSRRRCPQPFQRLVVGRDGRVSPCCADWDQQYVLGNISTNSLLELWNSDKMNYIRDIQNIDRIMRQFTSHYCPTHLSSIKVIPYTELENIFKRDHLANRH